MKINPWYQCSYCTDPRCSTWETWHKNHNHHSWFTVKHGWLNWMFNLKLQIKAMLRE